MIPHEHWQPNYGGLMWLGGVCVVMFVVLLIALAIERRRRG